MNPDEGLEPLRLVAAADQLDGLRVRGSRAVRALRCRFSTGRDAQCRVAIGVARVRVGVDGLVPSAREATRVSMSSRMLCECVDNGSTGRTRRRMGAL